MRQFPCWQECMRLSTGNAVTHASGSNEGTDCIAIFVLNLWFPVETYQTLKLSSGRDIDLTLFIHFFNKYSPNHFKIRNKNIMLLCK